MKNLKMSFIAAVLLLLNSDLAFSRCNPRDPDEQHGCVAHGPPLNFGILKAEIFGKLYCEIGSKTGSGISISADGRVGYFANNLGAPNPMTYFHVIASFSGPFDHQAPFSIGEFMTVGSDPTGQENQYILHRDVDVLSSGEHQFSPKACD